MSIKTKGINHPALFGKNLDETIKFYTEVLGMSLVLRQPNLNEPRMTHLFFSAGNGAFIAFFVPKDDTIEEAMETLNKYKIKFSGPIDRGYERSLYFNDPNEIKIEFMSWITPLPVSADEADVISRAQIIRENEEAYNIEDKHMRQAMIELGFPQVT